MQRRHVGRATLAALLWQLPILAEEPQPVAETAVAPPATATTPVATAAFPPAPPPPAPPAAAPPVAAPPAAPVVPAGYVLVPIAEQPGQPAPPAPPSAPSPSDRNHDGFYLRLSLGPGYFWDSVETTPESGLDEKYRGSLLSLDILVGATVLPGLILGGGIWYSPGLRFRHQDITAETQLQDDYQLAFGQFGPFADYYLNPKEGLHLQAAINWAALSIDSTDIDAESSSAGVVDASGFAIRGGVGYDFWLSDRWSVGALGSLSYSFLDEKSGGVTTKHRIWSPTVVASFTLN